MTKQELIAFVNEEVRLWEAGKIKAPCHFAGGNESQLIEIFKEIKPHDYVFSSHRNSYHALLHGVDPNALMAEIMGDVQGPCNGRARSMGFIDPSHQFYASAIVGGVCNIAVGVAWALKQEQDNFHNDPLNIDEFAVKPPARHVHCFIGDGVLDGGHFWESLQYARAYDLPINFIVENNNRATCTSIEDRLGKGHLPLNWGVWNNKVIYYNYEPTHQHVGSKVYVQF